MVWSTGYRCKPPILDWKYHGSTETILREKFKQSLSVFDAETKETVLCYLGDYLLSLNEDLLIREAAKFR